MAKKKGAERPEIRTFRGLLDTAGPPPARGSGAGGGYATRFGTLLAAYIANALRERFPGIMPDATGKGVESPSRALRGLKRLDINYSTPQAGLGFGISLKSVHVPDKNPKHRYHHNRKRNDEELRVEAAGYHQRQPFAVLVAVVVLPVEACDDADKRPSSFGMWVQYLWPLAKRTDPQDDVDRFELVFVALYDASAASIGFFDVTQPPPMQGRPTKLLSVEEFSRVVASTYDKRNSLDFTWESGGREDYSDDET